MFFFTSPIVFFSLVFWFSIVDQYSQHITGSFLDRFLYRQQSDDLWRICLNESIDVSKEQHVLHHRCSSIVQNWLLKYQIDSYFIFSRIRRPMTMEFSISMVHHDVSEKFLIFQRLAGWVIRVKATSIGDQSETRLCFFFSSLNQDLSSSSPTRRNSSNSPDVAYPHENPPATFPTETNWHDHLRWNPSSLATGNSQKLLNLASSFSSLFDLNSSSNGKVSS